MAFKEAAIEAAEHHRETIVTKLVRLGNRQYLDEESRKLDDVIVRAPGMAVARADREAKPPIEFGRRIEIADRMDNVIETTGYDLWSNGLPLVAAKAGTQRKELDSRFQE